MSIVALKWTKEFLSPISAKTFHVSFFKYCGETSFVLSNFRVNISIYVRPMTAEVGMQLHFEDWTYLRLLKILLVIPLTISCISEKIL